MLLDLLPVKDEPAPPLVVSDYGWLPAPSASLSVAIMAAGFCFAPVFVPAAEPTVPPLSWASVAPDMRAAAHDSAVLATTFAAPSAVVPPWDAWACAPDARAEPPRRPIGDIAYVPAPTRWGVDWLPAYPDQAAVPPRSIARDGIAPVLFVPLAPAWLPTAPERQLALTARPLGEFAYVPAVNRWGLEDLPWLPVAPEQQSRLAARPPGVFAFSEEEHDAGVFAFLPIAPDRQQLAAVRPPGENAYVPAINKWGLEDLPWLPVAPDKQRQLAPAPAGLFAFVEDEHAEAATLAWEPVAPVAQQTLTPRPTGDVGYTPAINRWGLEALPWLPTYPPLQRLAPLGLALGSVAFVEDEHVPADFEVASVAPERQLAAPARPAGDIAYVPALNRWGLEDLPWLPTYPATQRVTPPPTAVGWVAFVEDEHVSADFAAWVIAPERQQRLPERPAGDLAYVPAINRWGLEDLPWLPVAPAALPAAERLIPSGAVFVEDEHAEAADLSWAAQYHSQQSRPPAPALADGIAYVPAVNQWGVDRGEPLGCWSAPDRRVPDAALTAQALAWTPLAAPAASGWLPTWPAPQGAPGGRPDGFVALPPYVTTPPIAPPLSWSPVDGASVALQRSNRDAVMASAAPVGGVTPSPPWLWHTPRTPRTPRTTRTDDWRGV